MSRTPLLHRGLLAATLLLSTACDDEVDPTPVDSVEDTEDTTPTDTDDTSPVDTGDTGPTDSGAIDTTIPNIRDNTGGWATDTLLRIRGGAVTATYTGSGGVPSFTVQAPGTSSRGALLVRVQGGASLPSVGDEVSVTGAYEEFSLAGGLVDATVLKIGPTWPGTTFEVTGSAAALSALVRDPVQLETNRDDYEFMLIKLEERDTNTEIVPLRVTSAPNAAGRFDVRGSGPFTLIPIAPVLHNLTTTFPDLDAGSTFNSLTGPYLVSLATGAAELAPRSAADALGYEPPPIDTGDSGDTEDTGDSGDTGDTGDSGFVLPGIDTLTDADLTISEIMLDPEGCVPAAFGQYVEVYYGGVAAVDLQGLTLTNAAGASFTINQNFEVGPSKRYFLMHNGPNGNGCYGFSEAGWAGGFELDTLSETLTLSAGGITFDIVDMNMSFPNPGRGAIEFSQIGFPGANNDDGSSWCQSVDTFPPFGDRGTPAAPNTCFPGDTDIPGPDVVTPALLHGGAIPEDAEVIVRNLLVTAVFDGPAAFDAWFTAQVNVDPPQELSGLWVFKGGSAGLPQVGDVVDIQGLYDPRGSRPGRRALDVVNVSGVGYPAAEVIILSSGNPPPTPLDVGDGSVLREHAAPAVPPGEAYEGMVVTANPVPVYQGCEKRSPNNRPFLLVRKQGLACSDANYRYIGGWFFNVHSLDANGVVANDEISRLTGVVRFEERESQFTHYDINPRSAADVDYTDN